MSDYPEKKFKDVHSSLFCKNIGNKDNYKIKTFVHVKHFLLSLTIDKKSQSVWFCRLYYKSLDICNLQEIDRFRSKQVSSGLEKHKL
jgi:hypothetical protein